MKSSMRPLFSIVLALAVFSCYSTPTYAWGGAGHRIVAMIAERNISPDTQLRIKQILGDVKLASVANYADDVRDDNPWTANFHFVDIPIDDEDVTDDVYKPSRDCKWKPKGDCVLAAIPRFRNHVLSANSSPGDRAFALKFIIHLVGDMHQPLHCAEKNNDFGGGGVSVRWFGSWTDLHKVWDTRIIVRPQLTDEQYVAGLINGSTPQEMNEMRNGNILRWALEAHQLAGEFAYDLPADKKLGDDYYKKSWPIVHRQLLRGGMRLARVLDWLFAPHTGPNSADPLVLQP